jgi:hypothetical protein
MTKKFARYRASQSLRCICYSACAASKSHTHQRCALHEQHSPVPGEYVVLLFPSVDKFKDTKSTTVELRVLCMYALPSSLSASPRSMRIAPFADTFDHVDLIFWCASLLCAFAHRHLPLFMPHIEKMSYFCLIGQANILVFLNS